MKIENILLIILISVIIIIVILNDNGMEGRYDPGGRYDQIVCLLIDKIVLMKIKRFIRKDLVKSMCPGCNKLNNVKTE